MFMIRTDTINANCLVAIVLCFIVPAQSICRIEQCFWHPKKAVFYNIDRGILLAVHKHSIVLVADDA